MNVKKTVKKIIALGTGATMVGATILGATAYDLADFPADYIVSGVFDGTIVVGEMAATNDVLGAIDIAAALQAASTSTQAVQIPNQANQVTLEGDAFKIETSSDQLELREPAGDVVDTVTEQNLVGLKSGHLSTSEGDTDYFQYLRLKDASALQEFGVNYHENDDNVISDYLVIDADLPFLEWEIQFPEGFESERETNGDLDDYDDKSFNILGTDFTVVSASVDADSTDFTTTLMGGSLSDTLREGETKTYTLNGVEYELTLIFVSDPSNSNGNIEAKFMVNGEVTPAMQEGDTETVSGGIQIGVRDILANARDGVASFFLGADKVQITDATTDGSSTYDGTIKINNENINDGDIEVLGSFTDTTNGTFEITSIKYRLTMDADSGTIAYIPSGQGAKEFMDKPEALISDTLDIRYEGLTGVERTDVKFDSSGDDKYHMTFTNILGQEYAAIPLLSNDGGTWKFGDEDDELVFVEGIGPTDYVIGRQDYFVVSNYRSDPWKSVSNVIRYEDYDSSSRTIEFEDLGNGNTLKVTVTAGVGGNGDLVVGGHTYKVYVNQSTNREPLLAIDLDGDNGWNDSVAVTTWGGVVINLAAAIDMDANSSNDLLGSVVADLQSVVGNGLTIEDGANFAEGTNAVTLVATVDDSLFDTSGTDETFNWSINAVQSGNEADLSFASGSVTGPFSTAGTDTFEEFDWAERADDDDHQVGMTDYGILIDEYNPSGNDPNELVLSVPEQQVLAQVFVTLGSVEAIEGGAGVTTEVVNPISVGLAVLDKDAPAVGSDNLIVVGGPCANTVAAELLGNPSPCGSGFTPGKALIKSWENNGKVSILVAGYEAQETLGASYVLANHGDYAALQGDEVEVVVPDLSNLVVQAVTAPADDAMADDTMMDDTTGDDTTTGDTTGDDATP